MNNWTFTRKLAFRFLFPFIILWTAIWNHIPFLRDWIYQYEYYPSFLLQKYILGSVKSARWIHFPTGSGDTLDDWFLLLAYVLLSIFICVVWSVLDRKRLNYEKLEGALLIGLRYFVAMTMLVYGIEKLFLLQMPYPSLTQFYTPLGEFTPMRFTWLHTGYSPAYEFIGGFLETIGGLLLLFRRTKVLGGLILIVVMSQVVMLNYFYGVPVKIFSTFLLLAVLYIIKSELIILGKFILGQSNQTIKINPFSTKKVWVKWTRIILKAVFICYTLGSTAYSCIEYLEMIKLSKTELYGAYKVMSYVKNREEIAPHLDEERWNFVVFGEGYEENESYTLIRKGFSNYYKAKTTLFPDNRIKIKFRGSASTFKGDYKKSDDEIELSGILSKDTLHLKLVLDDRELTLPNREFMWVMEQKDF